MSAFLLGTGFRADMGTCIRKLVLLKLIDACEDDGSRIFPAMKTVARAAQCSERQVQREIRAFLDIGLLRLVREGGKGPRSTNEYALDVDMLHRLGRDGWGAVAGEGSGEKGDTQSPLDEADKGDTGDAERVTETAAKGDSHCHPTPPDSSIDPSSERGRGREERKKENRFWALAKRWPGFAGMPKEPALKVWLTLADDEMDEAERKFDGWLALLKAQRKSHVPAPSTYFGEKLFRDVPEPVAEQKPEFVAAPVFGPVWGGLRFVQFLTIKPIEGPKPSVFMATELERDDERGRQARRTRQATHGWPRVNHMHAQALSRKGEHVRAALAEKLKPLMEPVMVASPLWGAWRDLHEARGWPWLPDPGTHPVVFFPAGGPEALDRFEAGIRDEGTDDDGGSQQAA